MLKRVFCMLVVAIMLSTLFVGTAFAATQATTRTVSIFKVTGSNVKMTKGTEKEFNAKANVNLYDGYTVSTGSESYCWLKLDDGSLLKMDQKSKIKVSKVSSKKLSISVLSGGLSVDAETQESGNEVEVRVGNSALAIRGTYFTVENVTGGSALYTMFEGSGEVDGYELPSGYIMNVYNRNDNKNTSSNTKSNQSTSVHELAELEINDNTSIFVLQTVLDDVERFVENGTITKDDISEIGDLLKKKLEESKNKSEEPTYKTKASYYLPNVPTVGSDSNSDSGGYVVNKTWLQEALTAAHNTQRATFVNTAATHVYAGWQWVKQADMDVFHLAIENAQNVYDTATTLQQIISARNNLLFAISKFESAKKLGIKTPPPEIAALQTSMINSSEAKKDIYISVDGMDVYEGSYWVTMTDLGTLNNAIANAYDATNAVIATQAINARNRAGVLPEIIVAADNLNATVTWFNTVKQSGKKPLDKGKLLAAIEHAKFVASDVKVDTDGSNTDPGDYWITQDVLNWLLSGIAVAEERYKTVIALQDIEFAIQDINSWVYYTNDHMKWGTKLPDMPLTEEEKSELKRAIADAKEAMIGIRVSEGYDVDPDQFWVLPWLYTYLNNAILKGESALDTVQSINQVYDEASKLDFALKIFNTYIMQGSLNDLPLPHNDMLPLINAIAAAKTALDSVVVSETGEELVNGTRWAPEWAVDFLRLEWTFAIKMLKSVQDAEDVLYRADLLYNHINYFNAWAMVILVDYTSLNLQITSANTVMQNVAVSEKGDGTDITDGKAFVTQSVMDELRKAITIAENAQNTATTQKEVNNATQALTLAIAKFQAAIQGGNAWVMKGEKYGTLVEAIAVAKPGDTIELVEDGFIYSSLVNETAWNVLLNGINLTINEGVTLTIDKGALNTAGNSTIINNGTIINDGVIGENSNGGTYINNGTINNNGIFSIPESVAFNNAGEFNNNIYATATIKGSCVNTGKINNYSLHVLFNANISRGLTILGTFTNKGEFYNSVDATAKIEGDCVNTGIIINDSTDKMIWDSYTNLYLYYDGLIISGAFTNAGEFNNNMYATAKIENTFINTGRINNYRTIQIIGTYINKENGNLYNSGIIYLSGGQCEITDIGIFTNDGTVNINLGGMLKFSLESSFTNNGTLMINGEFIYTSNKNIINNAYIEVGQDGSVRIDSPAKIIGTSMMSMIYLILDSSNNWGDTDFSIDGKPLISGAVISAGMYIWNENGQCWAKFGNKWINETTGVRYASLALAVENAALNDTIKLTADDTIFDDLNISNINLVIESGVTLTNNATLTIGKTITNNGRLNNYGTLWILQDATFANTGIFTNGLGAFTTILGECIFSGAASFINTGEFSIGSEGASGSFSYTSSNDIINAGIIMIQSGNVVINSLAKLIGGLGMPMIYFAFDSDDNWGNTIFYAGDSFLTPSDTIPTGYYIWDGANQCWRFLTPLQTNSDYETKLTDIADETLEFSSDESIENASIIEEEENSDTTDLSKQQTEDESVVDYDSLGI